MDLTENEISLLRVLNHKVADIEVEVKKEMLEIQNRLDSRVLDQCDFLEDYNIECHVTFFMRDDEAAHSDMDNKILTELVFEKIMDDDNPHEIGSGANVNIFSGNAVLPLHNDNHCWLFRCLYEEPGLSWEEIMKIGTVWIDVDVSHKKTYCLQP